jgi:hypothetical protein
LGGFLQVFLGDKIAFEADYGKDSYLTEETLIFQNKA